MKRIKLRNARPKAILGIGESSAILAAAGIQAAATGASALMQSNAAKDAARQQAAAVQNAATSNARALAQQNENSNILQENSQEFIRNQNEENRQIQRDMQMNLQLLAGGESMNDRRAEAKIQVKNGGKVKRKNTYTSLQGNNNMKFRVTDGGGVIPIGVTPEGYDLYELYGNDHEHRHKTKGGKSKTGVGIKFEDGQIIEGEGNQNSNRGERLLVTPDDAMFISKHSIGGFNPSNAIDRGMHPLAAYNLQEILKATNGISNDGKRYNSSPVKAMYGMSVPFLPSDYVGNPDFSTDITLPAIIGATAVNKQKVACGGRVHRRLRDNGRLKASIGASIKNWWNNSVLQSNKPQGQRFGAGTMFASAGINTLGNFGGALISTIGNNRANSILSKAYDNAAGIMSDAYSKLHGIDMSSIKREDYAPTHAMAAVRSARQNVNPQLEAVNRNLANQQLAVNNSTLSSAARLNRLNRFSDIGQQQRNEIYANQSNAEEQIKQQNLQQINTIANENANRDSAANKDYTSAYLNLLQYNNDIENEKIAGAAQARADAMTAIGANAAQTRQLNAGAWASALANSGNAFSNVMQTLNKQNTDFANIYSGLDESGKVSVSIALGENGRANAASLFNKYKDSDNEVQQGYAKQLNDAFGFDPDWKPVTSSTQVSNNTHQSTTVPSVTFNVNDWLTHGRYTRLRDFSTNQ